MLQECKVQEVKVADASSRNTNSSGIVSDSTNSSENDCSKTGDDQSLRNQSSTSGNESITSGNDTSKSGNECRERRNSGNDIDIRPSYDTDPMAEDEHVLLASLIAKLKLDVDENKKSQKQLKKANMSLTQELEKRKQDLEKSKQDLEISKQDLSYYKSELAKYKNFQTNQKEKEKAELESVCVKEENAKLVNQISTHESRISQILKEKEQMKKDFKERENKDIDKLIALENQVKFLNNIVYKTDQFVQTKHTLTPKPSSYYTGLGVSSFINSLYLKKAQLEKPCLYNVKYDKNDLANLFAPESDETIKMEIWTINLGRME
ncbi:hypothetical protein Tco_0930191 [Tanacetum coccineum]